MNNDIAWDIETYPNVFTMAVEHCWMPFKWAFEISPWRNDSREIVAFFRWVAASKGRMVGFNSLNFDYPTTHYLLNAGELSAGQLYSKAMAIIQSNDDEEAGRFYHMVKPSDRHVQQIDLFKVHHFDNRARSTSLKALEFAMRSDHVEDMPIPVGTVITQDQLPVLKSYNAHDVSETKKFYHYSLEAIKFREELLAKHPGKDWLNFSDVKIGVEFFMERLEAAGVQCYTFGPEGRKPRQTRRASIALREAILPWIRFENPEFHRVHQWLLQQVITETKGVFEGVTASVGGIEFVFGLGGIHASVENEVIRCDPDTDIVDIDVEGYYPSTAIAQGFKPAHFPAVFSEIYAGLKEERAKYPKGTSINKALKLAGNGAYGNSNNQFSPLLDPMMTMQTTLNGQLLLCLLVEQLIKITGLRVVQANTDGITVKCPKAHRAHMAAVITWWEGITKLKMEFAEYDVMCIRDVNNYIARYTNGKVKRIGAYEWKHEKDGGRLRWDQNHSALVVPKVAEKVLLEGAPIRETVEQWPDLYDFLLRVKVPRTSRLVCVGGNGAAGVQEPLPNTTRYHIAKQGVRLFKIMPPLAKNPGVYRTIGVESGWNVRVCNDIKDADRALIDSDYYVREVEKLCNILR